MNFVYLVDDHFNCKLHSLVSFCLFVCAADIDAIVSMKADIVQINGKDHYKIDDIYVEFNIGGASVLLTNLFNGDEELGAAMNRFLNENWKEVAAEMRPALSRAIDNILRSVTGQLFETFPLEQILPD